MSIVVLGLSLLACGTEQAAAIPPGATELPSETPPSLPSDVTEYSWSAATTENFQLEITLPAGWHVEHDAQRLIVQASEGGARIVIEELGLIVDHIGYPHATAIFSDGQIEALSSLPKFSLNEIYAWDAGVTQAYMLHYSYEMDGNTVRRIEAHLAAPTAFTVRAELSERSTDSQASVVEAVIGSLSVSRRDT